MSVSISIEVNDAAVQGAARDLAAKLSPEGFNRLRQSIGTEMVNLTKRAFRDSGARPAPWPPAKAALGRTRVASGKKGGSRGTLLRDTGALYDSINYQLAGIDSIRIGTAMPYAAAHQFGFSGSVTQRVPEHQRRVLQAFGRPLAQPKTATVRAHSRTMNQNLPARPFLPIDASGNISPQAVEKINQVTTRFLKRP